MAIFDRELLEVRAQEEDEEMEETGDDDSDETGDDEDDNLEY